jgi:hypothetical protein
VSNWADAVANICRLPTPVRCTGCGHTWDHAGAPRQGPPEGPPIAVPCVRCGRVGQVIVRPQGGAIR